MAMHKHRSACSFCSMRKGARLATALFGALLIATTAYAQVPSPRVVRRPNPDRQIPDHPVPASVPNGFSVIAVGDLIMAHPAPTGSDAGFARVRKLIQGADVAFGNLEGTLVDPGTQDVWVAAQTGGGDEWGPPSLAMDIKRMGFDLLSHANNHTTDWGIRGMENTDRVLDKAGLVHAGTGANLAHARRPVYLTTPSGRIALVAMTSSHTSMEPAGPRFRGVRGRPGVNVLRTRRYHIVTAGQMACLRKIYDNQLHKPSHPANPHAKNLRLFGVHYRVGARQGIAFRMNRYDLDDILRNVREGKEESNFEIVYVHAHEPGNWSRKPASFMQTLAHDAINTGADEFVASGPHRLRGIEIYKGKPIFYSLGDFFMEVEHRIFVDPDHVRPAHLDMATTTNYEFQHKRLSNRNHPEIRYQSVMALSVFDAKGNIREVELYPIDLGYHRVPSADSGVPQLASPRMAGEILHRLQRLSQPYGTHIEIHGNVGVIRIAAHK